MMKRFATAMREAPPEQREQMARALAPPIADDKKNRMTMEDVQKVVDHPVQQFLSGEVRVMTLGLLHIPFTIVETAESPGFITSDAPCAWFDSELYKKSPAFGAGGLISPTLEICMPLSSPQQLVLFGHRHIADNLYLPPTVGNRLVDLTNRRMWDFADEHVVVNQRVEKQPWRDGGWEQTPGESHGLWGVPKTPPRWFIEWRWLRGRCPAGPPSSPRMPPNGEIGDDVGAELDTFSARQLVTAPMGR